MTAVLRVPLPDQPLDANSGIHHRNDVFQNDGNLGNIKIDHNTGRLLSFIRYNINKTQNSSPTLLLGNRLTYPGTL